MSWRSQGITGSNNIPLGNRRRFGGDSNGDSQNGGYEPSPSNGTADSSYKRGRSPARGESLRETIPTTTNRPSAEPAEDGVKRRKKRNRWGDAQENKAAGLMGLPTMIQANMTSEQLEAYTLHLRIEEISQKLRINDVVPADGDRYVHSQSNVQNHTKPPPQITISSTSV
jgi:splicing factor 1